MSGSEEYKTLVKYTSDLILLLQHDIVSISAKLLEKGLVSEDTYQEVLSTDGISDQKKAAELLSCVRDQVKESGSSSRFYDFVGVLKEDAYFDDIVKKLIQAPSKFTCCLQVIKSCMPRILYYYHHCSYYVKLQYSPSILLHDLSYS